MSFVSLSVYFMRCMPLQWIFIFSLMRKRADVARIVSRTDQMTEQKRPPQERVHSLLY